MSDINIKIKQFNLKINMLFFLLLLIMHFTGYLSYFLLVFACIALHELSHILSALILGAKVDVVRILPIGLNAQIQEDTCQRQAKTVIYLSGPAFNLLLFLTGLVMNSYYLLQSDNMRFFISINLYLATFNILPVLPLDGGKILINVLSEQVGIFVASRYMKRISFLLSGLLVLLGIAQFLSSLNNFSLFLAGIYIMFCIKSDEMGAALMNSKYVIYRRSKLLKNGVYPARDLVVMKFMHMSDILKNMDFDRFHIIHVLDENLRLIKVFTEQEIIDGMLKYDTDITFEEFVEKCTQIM